MDPCHTYKYNVTMDINQCCFYGNIFAILCQIFTKSRSSGKSLEGNFEKNSLDYLNSDIFINVRKCILRVLEHS